MVLDAIQRYYTEMNANVHRGLHTLADRATTAFEEARARVAAFINAPDPACCIWTRNTTEAINLVAATWGRANLRPGDEILTTVMEHHSNLVPWQLIATETGAQAISRPHRRRWRLSARGLRRSPRIHEPDGSALLVAGGA